LNERVSELTKEVDVRGPLFREGRDARGRLALRSAHESRGLIADLPLVDVVDGGALVVRDLF
jgi:hypothetical protein